MRVCKECGAEYEDDSKQKRCNSTGAFGPCWGEIIPPPAKPGKEKKKP